jgi:hypothetical protein
MIEHAVRVGATTARERVPERIAEALAADAVAETQAGLRTVSGATSASAGEAS